MKHRKIVFRNKRGLKRCFHTAEWASQFECLYDLQKFLKREGDPRIIQQIHSVVQGSTERKRNWIGYPWDVGPEEDMNQIADRAREPSGEADKLAEMMKEVSRGVPNRPEQAGRRMRWCEQGEIEFDRWRRGDPWAREVSRRKLQQQEFVTIIIQVASCQETLASKMMWRGAAGLALSESLERAGYTTRIVSCEFARSVFQSGRGFFSGTTIKDFGEQINLHSIAGVVSSWWPRTIGFASTYLIPGETPVLNYGEEVDVSLDLMQLIYGGRVTLIGGAWCRDGARSLVGSIIETQYAQTGSLVV